MHVSHLDQGKLRTGNNALDVKIGFLLSSVGGNIDSLLNGNGRIICKKIDLQLEGILSGIDTVFHEQIKRTLSSVRGKLNRIIVIGIELNGAQSLVECNGVVAKYGERFILNIISFNTILSKCRSLVECEGVIEKYGEGITLDSVSYCIIFRILVFSYGNDDISVLQALIHDTLVNINSFHLSKESEDMLICTIFGANGECNDFIYSLINELSLQNLYFLNLYLQEGQVKGSNNGIIGNTQDEAKGNQFEMRFREAIEKGLSQELAALITYGGLSNKLGGGGTHCKKGSHFGGKQGFQFI